MSELKKDACCGSSQDACCSSEGKGCCKKKGAIALLLVAAIVLIHVLSFTYGAERIATRVLEKNLENEYAKVGGKENYDLMAKAQALSLKSQLPQIKAFIEQTEKSASVDSSGAKSPAANAKSVSPEEIASVFANSYVEGKKDARILLVEYSDMECPYCIRQYKDGTIKEVTKKYGDNVAHIFKPFKAVAHPGADPKAVAALCAGQIGGAEQYAKFYMSIFDKSEQGSVMPVSDLSALAKTNGLDQKKFDACYNDKKTLSIYQDYTKEGKKFGATGTPGTVIIDTKTGKYLLVDGAYPAADFITAIDSLLK